MNSRKPLSLLFFAFVFSWRALAVATMETDDLMKVAAKTVELGKKFGVSHVLTVYDLDNTLLAMDQPLGSDQWFNWQAAELTSAHPKDLVAPDFQGLLEVQGELFALSHMHPVQKNAAAVLGSLQEVGFHALLLSSRGPDFRNSTERELARNQLDFGRTPIAPREGYPGEYLPYSPDKMADSGVSSGEAKAFGLGTPRKVSYMGGIYMVAGQHKGAMLRMLLHKTKQAFAAIVFVDDQKIHCDRMAEAYAHEKAEMVSVHYIREAPNVRRFDAADKASVTQDWKKLRHALDEAFPSTSR